MRLRIANWQKFFENNESRKLRSLKWVPMPNRMNTQGYTALVDHPNGAAHFGAWCAIVEICSAREPRELRGTLPEADGTIRGISRVLGRISRLSASVFEELLPRLISDPEIKWIEQFTGISGKSPEASGESPDEPGKFPQEGKGREGKGTEEKKTKASDPVGSGLSLVPSPENEEPAEDAPSKEIPSDTPSVVRSPVSAKRKAPKRTTEEIKAALGAKRLPWWEGFWSVYPCHDGMRDALDAYERRVDTRELAVEIYNGAKRYAEQIAAKRRADPDTPVKYAQGWLNGERWRDDAPPPLPVVPCGPQVKYWDPKTITGERV